MAVDARKRAAALGSCPVSAPPPPPPFPQLMSQLHFAAGILLPSFLTDCRRGKCLPRHGCPDFRNWQFKNNFFFYCFKIFTGASLEKDESRLLESSLLK